MIKNLEIEDIKFILRNNYIGQLGYIFLNKPYVVPITYYFDEHNHVIICYSGEGHKTRAMRKNNAVALQVSNVNSVNHWKSVLVHGTFEQHFGGEAKAYLHQFSLGVKQVILEKEHLKPDFISEFSSKIYKDDIPIVYLIRIDEITGKIRSH